jgi:hypothetical protein
LWQQAIYGVRNTRPAHKQACVFFLVADLLARRDYPTLFLVQSTQPKLRIAGYERFQYNFFKCLLPIGN